MKKFITIAITSLLITSAAYAQNEGEDKKTFAEIKPEIIANLNKEKSIIDSAISCVNSAQLKEDAKKCRDQKKSAMDALKQQREAAHQQRIGNRKQHLQDELKKMDEKSAKLAK
jgi:hypothetical protein